MLEFTTAEGKEIALHGLQPSMEIELLRSMMTAGHMHPTATAKVQEALKATAKLVYNQEKFCDEYHPRVCERKHAIAYFLCAVHRQNAPQKQKRKHGRFNPSIGTESSQSSDDSHKDEAILPSGRRIRQPISLEKIESKFLAPACPKVRAGSTCELPKLHRSNMLPLSYWDSVWYALVAEIKFVYEDLKVRFGEQFERGETILHGYGVDGNFMAKYTVWEFAKLLENCWDEVMNYRHIAALDFSVRQRNLVSTNDAVPKTFQTLEAPGLVDVDVMTPDDIWDMLWKDHAPAVQKAVRDNVQADGRLMGARTAMRRWSPKVKYGLSPKKLDCICPSTCTCRAACSFCTAGCECAITRQRTILAVRQQEKGKAQTHSSDDEFQYSGNNHFLGAATNTLAQMQIASLATPSDSVMAGAVAKLQDVVTHHDQKQQEMRRTRSATNGSDLAYVADKTPSNNPKDSVPLGFYGDWSGQRYPAEARARPKLSDQPPPIYGPAFYLNNVPRRKPIPAPEPSPSDDELFQYPLTRTHANANNIITLAASSPDTRPAPLGDSYFANEAYTTKQVTRSFPTTSENIKYTQPKGNFTQSFEAPARGNTRQADAEPYPFLSESPPLPPGSQLGFRKRESHDRTDSYFTQSHRKQTSSGAQSYPTFPDFEDNPDIPQDGFITPSYKSIAKPDYINPKPATIQRYVKAGPGPSLHEREIISEVYLPQNEDGCTMTKQELFNQINHKEIAEHNVKVQSLRQASTPPRSKRASGASDREESARQRNSSGTGRMSNRLKRVFSRKNSECD